MIRSMMHFHSADNKNVYRAHRVGRLCLFVALMLFLSGCTSGTTSAIPPEPIEVPPVVVEEPPVVEPEIIPDDSLEWIQRWNAGRPVFVMIDNHSGARPQSGLKNALMVYEFLAEGSITRYMAVFNGVGGEEIGPVRSARPYFINRALEMNALYVHVGGSPQAFNDLVRLKVGDIDGLSAGNSIFWRENHKKIPHNMYTTLDAIRKEADRRHYVTEVAYEVPAYHTVELPQSGEPVTAIELAYRSSTSKNSAYIVRYHYDVSERVYQRSINGENHLDELDKTPITAKNLIIQTIKTKTMDSEGRLELEDVGSGTGWFVSLGVRVPLTWKKADRRAQTIYTLESGDILELNPGTTWIQVIPQWITPVWNEEA